jgi:hypothetical protein
MFFLCISHSKVQIEELLSRRYKVKLLNIGIGFVYSVANTHILAEWRRLARLVPDQPDSCSFPGEVPTMMSM